MTDPASSQKAVQEIQKLRSAAFDATGLTSQTIASILKYASHVYYNSALGDKVVRLTDDEYDLLLATLKRMSPTTYATVNTIGATPSGSPSPISGKTKVRLPCHMGSLNKVKPHTGFLQKWIAKFPSPTKNASIKADGVSGLFIVDEGTKYLFTRGDGTFGGDITSLIPYIPCLRNLEFDPDITLMVRGELIISKFDFEKYSDLTDNARNMCSGLINSKHLDTEKLSNVRYVAYEVITDEPITITEQFEILEELGFEPVQNMNIPSEDLTDEALQDLLVKWREESFYMIDGLVVVSGDSHTRNTSGNPDYAFAFKDYDPSQIADVTVRDVEWSLSKDGLFKPVLLLETTLLSGARISHVTAFNAKYIVDNNIGPGSVVKLVRSGEVIPYILEVVKSTEAKLPDVPFIWNKTQVDILADPDTLDQDTQDQINVKILANFFKKLSIKYMGERTVERIYETGFETIADILSATIEDLCKVPRFGRPLATKVYDELHSGIEAVDLAKLMAASNVFGHGMGETVLSSILQHFPDLMDMRTISESDIRDIDGLGPVRARQFVEKFEEFRTFLESVPMIGWYINDGTPLVTNSNGAGPHSSGKDEEDDFDPSELGFPSQGTGGEEGTAENGKDEVDPDDPFITTDLQGKVVVFSGFRSRDWEFYIQQMGGQVKPSFTRATSLVIIKDYSKKTAKIEKAEESGVEIITCEDFAEKYNLKTI